MIVLFATLDAVSVELAGHRHSHTANDKIKFVQTKLLSKKKSMQMAMQFVQTKLVFFKKKLYLVMKRDYRKLQTQMAAHHCYEKKDCNVQTSFSLAPGNNDDG